MVERTGSRRQRRAFTLVEVSAVLLVILIISGIAMVSMANVRTNGEIQSIDTSLRDVEQQAIGAAANSEAGAARDPRVHLTAATGTVEVPQEEIDAGTADAPVVDVGAGIVFMRRYEQCRALAVNLDTRGLGTVGDHNDVYASVTGMPLGVLECESGNFAPAGTNETDPPGTPTTTATPVLGTNGDVHVTWNAPGSGGAVSSYEITYFRDSDADGEPDQGAPVRHGVVGTDPAVDGGPDAALLDALVPDLEPGVNYRFCVTASNNVGTGAPGCDDATPTADDDPSTPDPSATAGNQTAMVNWKPNPAAERVTYYNVKYTDNPGLTGSDPSSDFAGGQAFTTPTPSYAAAGLDNGTEYYFFVQAVNGSDRRSGWGRASATPTTAGTVDAPDWVRAEVDADGQSIVVTWDASDTPGVVHYDVQRKPEGSGSWTTIANTAGQTLDLRIDDNDDGLAVTAPSVGVTYAYQVRAVVDLTTASDWAGPATARIGDGAAPTGVPGQVRAEVFAHEGNGYPDARKVSPAGNAPWADDGKGSTFRTQPVNNEIEVDWTLPADADRAAVRILLNGDRIAPDAGSRNADFGPSVTDIALVDVPDGVYVVTVLPVDATGNLGTPIHSNEVVIDTTAPPLPVRRTLHDELSDPAANGRPGDPDLPAHDLVLRWEVGPAYDLNDATFRIHRGAPGVAPASWPAVGEVDPADGLYRDDTVVWGETYCYYVVALDNYQVPQGNWFSNQSAHGFFDETADADDGNRGRRTRASRTGDEANSCRNPIDDEDREPAPDNATSEPHRRVVSDWPNSLDHARASGNPDFRIERRQNPGAYADTPNPYDVSPPWYAVQPENRHVDDDSDGDKPWLSEWCYRVHAPDNAGLDAHNEQVVNDAVGTEDCGIARDLFSPTSPGTTEPDAGYVDYPLHPDGYQPPTAGPAPTIVRENRNNRISWGAARDDYSAAPATGANRVTYVIERRIDSSQGDYNPPSGWVDYATTPSTTFNDRSWITSPDGDPRFEGPRWGTTYCYRISALDRASEHPRQADSNRSVPTAEVCQSSDDTVNPKAVLTAFNPNEGTVDVHWEASDDYSGLHRVVLDRELVGCQTNGYTNCNARVGATVTVYDSATDPQFRPNPDNAPDPPGFPGTSFNRTTNYTIPANEVWRWRLTVADWAGNRTVPTVVHSTWARPEQPGTPSGTRLEKAARVTWDAAALLDLDADHNCYQVDYRTTPQGGSAWSAWRTATACHASTTYLHGGSQPGNLNASLDYQYRVRAVDRGVDDRGTIHFSDWTPASNRVEVWARPFAVKVTNGDRHSGEAERDGTNDTVPLSWPAAFDEDGDVAGYRLYRAQGNCDAPTGALRQTLSGLSTSESLGEQEWAYYYVIPYDAEGHRSMPTRDYPSPSGSNITASTAGPVIMGAGDASRFHELCDDEPGWRQPIVDTTMTPYGAQVTSTNLAGTWALTAPVHTEVFHRLDATACDVTDPLAGEGNDPTGANQPGDGTGPPGSVTWEGPHYTSQSHKGGRAISLCQRITDKYGTVGPPSAPVNITTDWLRNPTDLNTGDGYFNYSAGTPEIRNASWQGTTSQARWYRLRWLDGAKGWYEPNLSGAWEYSNTTKGRGVNVQVWPHQAKVRENGDWHLQVKSCHPWYPNTTVQPHNCLEDHAQSQANAYAGPGGTTVQKQPTPTWSNHYNVVNPSLFATGNCTDAIIQVGKEWQKPRAAYCQWDPGSYPEDVGRNTTSGFYSVTSGRPSTGTTSITGFNPSGNTGWGCKSGYAFTGHAPDGVGVCSTGTIYYVSTGANTGSERLPVHRYNGAGGSGFPTFNTDNYTYPVHARWQYWPECVGCNPPSGYPTVPKTHPAGDYDGDGRFNGDWVWGRGNATDDLADCDTGMSGFYNEQNWSDHANDNKDASETFDWEDDDCDGSVDTGRGGSWWDNDRDWYPSTSSTNDGSGSSGRGKGGYDCNDNDSAINPGAQEWWDSVDRDCDGKTKNGLDQDGDTYGTTTYGGTDCNDGDAAIHPNATETKDDGVDSNCNGDDNT